MTGFPARADSSLLRTARVRWSTASDLLRLVQAEPGITRTQACARLNIASGAAAELIERLRAVSLLAEQRAARDRPGRPSTLLTPHPEGPLAVVVDLQSSGWRVVLGDLAGEMEEIAQGAYDGKEPAVFLPRIAEVIGAVASDRSGRLGIVVAAVAGTVSGTRLLQFSTRGWHEADLGALLDDVPPGTSLRLISGNDATLGGLAEARSGAARGASTALHILVAVGVGGVLLVDGKPLTGARGAGGEYGHLPLGDPAVHCPCGASGCWDLAVDGRALARHRGDEQPNDPVAYGRRFLHGLQGGVASDPLDRRAAGLTAHALGAGIAALVNLHDPDVVTIAGLAPDIRSTAPEAFDTGFRGGLMAFHRQDPPPVTDAAHGVDGPMHGALSLGFDEITDVLSLTRWEERTKGADTR